MCQWHSRGSRSSHNLGPQAEQTKTPGKSTGHLCALVDQNVQFPAENPAYMSLNTETSTFGTERTKKATRDLTMQITPRLYEMVHPLGNLCLEARQTSSGKIFRLNLLLHLRTSQAPPSKATQQRMGAAQNQAADGFCRSLGRWFHLQRVPVRPDASD